MLRVYQLSTAFPLAQYIYVGYKILLSFLMYIIVETIRIERRMFFFSYCVIWKLLYVS